MMSVAARHATWPVLAALLLAPALVSSPLAAQELKLRTLSPLASWNLSPRLGIAEDSLRSVGRGVWIHDVQAGNGARADSGMVLEVHYVGLLADGRIFDATESRPFAFTLGTGRVIDGWEDGLLGMRVGGRRQLVIPPHLGYGIEGAGAVPPDAVLVFDVTLVGLRSR